jgi:uncharacterized membrane protein YkvA (DUF1232 family)
MEWLAPVLAFLGVTVALWLVAVAIIWLHRPSRELALPALRLLPDILRLIRRLLADPTMPRSSKLMLLGLAVWIASPIDLLPEFLPGIGPLDDLVVAVIVLRRVGRRIGHEELARRWPGTPESFSLLARLL